MWPTFASVLGKSEHTADAARVRGRVGASAVCCGRCTSLCRGYLRDSGLVPFPFGGRVDRLSPEFA